MSSDIAKLKARYDRIAVRIKANKQMKERVVNEMDRTIQNDEGLLQKTEDEINALDPGVPLRSDPVRRKK